MLKINSDAFSFTLFDGLCHYTTLPKSSRAYQDKMICTMNELADIFHFVYSVCEVICIHDCTVFKGILHITTFFVTTFFVVGAKVRIFFETKKKMARNFNIFQSWGAKMTFAPSYSFTLEGADEEDGSGVPFLDQIDKRAIGVEVDCLIIHWGCGALYPYGYLSRASSTNAQRSKSL